VSAPSAQAWPCGHRAMPPERRAVSALSMAAQGRGVQRAWARLGVESATSGAVEHAEKPGTPLAADPRGLYPSPVRHATLHGPQMGRGSSREARVSALRPASRWPRGAAYAPGVCERLPRRGCVGGVASMERWKGRHRAKATGPRPRHGDPVRPCAWCAHPVYGDAVTVTFPDKAQVTFPVACLDQYRAVLWPRAAP